MHYNFSFMRLNYLIILLFFSNFCFSQSAGTPTPSTNPIDKQKLTNSLETTIFQIDLARPNDNSITTNRDRKKLAFNIKEPLQVELINGNPFKYTYTLNYNKINLFFDENLIPFDNTGVTIEQIQTADASKVIPGLGLTAPTEPQINNAQSSLIQELDKLSAKMNDYSLLLQLKDELLFDSFDNKRKEFKEEFVESYSKYKYILTEVANFPSPTSTTTSNNAKIQSLLDSIQEKLALFYNVETNSYLLPIDANGDNIDYVEITLQRTNIKTSVSETYTYKIWVKGGLKIDFSGGAFITSLFDTDYILTNSIDENGTPNGKQTITEQDTGNYDFGFGTVVNITPRFGSWIKPTINVGALFTTNQKFQLITGAGIILGKNERFIIHGGLTMGQASEIKNTYYADGTTQYQLGNNIPVDDKFKFGHYFGVTYNFSKPKSQQNDK